MNPYIGFLVFGFACGIALRFLSPHGSLGEPFVFASFLLFLALVIFLVSKRVEAKKLSGTLLVAVFIGSLGLGVFRVDVAMQNTGDALLDAVSGRHSSFEGVIVDEPDIRETHTKFTLRAEKIILAQGEEDVESKVLVTTSHFPEYSYGDRVRWSGVLEKPKNFFAQEGEEGRPFDYVSYLGKSDIYYQMFFPEGELISTHEGNAVRHFLFALKARFLENTARVIPEPASSLLGGIVVGAKQSLGKDLLDEFRITGIIHIVVLSGYNVTIVADAIGRVASYAPRMVGFVSSSLFIAAFALMTGAGATIVRASIMAFLVMVARMSGRVHAITSILFIAAFIMLVHNPKILLYDPSFQLSFLATIGLIYFSPRIEKLFSFISNVGGFRSVVGATLSTQIFVLPLLLYMMGEISLVAVPVNLLILLFIPATMLFGFLTAFFGLFGALFSLPFAYISYALLAYELKVVDFFAGLPFASVSVPSFPLWLVFSFYAFYVWVIWRGRRNVPTATAFKEM
ncbi:MAG: ComEC/Rec2 family competence protein [Candidatus Paceibacterota bacterium]